MIVDDKGRLVGLAVAYKIDRNVRTSVGVTSAILINILQDTYSLN